VASLGHRAEGGVAQPQDRGDEDLQHRGLVVGGVVEEAVLEAEAGVVDQQVDRPVAVGEPGLDRRELGAVGEVGDQHLDLHLVGAAQLLGHLLEAGGVTRHEDEVVAAGGELDGVLVADAGGRAGDQGSAHAPSISGRAGRVRGRPAQWPPMSTTSPGAAPVTLAVANQKGGVAKTTSVASIGAALAELGHRVLLVDLDPQACLTFSLGIDPEDLDTSVHHVLTQGVDPTEVIIGTEDGVDVLPATIELARAEADLLTRTGREHVIKGALEQLAEDLEDSEEGAYDWVLLDCPPSLGVLTVAALTAADGVLVPLQCETLSHRGVGQLLDTVHDVRRFTNRGLEVWGVLPTLYDGRTNHARTVLETISETYGLEVVEPPIPKTIKFAEAPAAGRSILATSRSSKGATAYREVARNLVERASRPRQKAGPARAKR
jgi:chromosome partitioning protein